MAINDIGNIEFSIPFMCIHHYQISD